MKKWIKFLVVIFIIFIATKIDLGCSAKLKEAHKVVINTKFNEEKNKEHYRKLNALDPNYIVERLGFDDISKLKSIEFYPSSFSNGKITYILKFDKFSFTKKEMEKYKVKINQEYSEMSKLQIDHSDILEDESKNKIDFVTSLFSKNHIAMYEVTDESLKQRVSREKFIELTSELAESVKGEVIVTPVLTLAYSKIGDTPYHFDFMYQIGNNKKFENIRISINPQNNKVMGIFL